MIIPSLFFYVFAGVCIASAVMVDLGEEPRAFGAVPDPRLRQRGRPVRADGRRVPGDDPDRRLCRRGRGAVPVRGDDARRRLRRAAAGLPQLPADRRRHRLHLPVRAVAGARRLGDRSPGGAHLADPEPRRGDEHRRARAGALHPLRLLLPDCGRRPADRHDRRHRADLAPQAQRQAAEHRRPGRPHHGDRDRDPPGAVRGRGSRP